MEGLSDMQTLLEEKEFQLWEKEGLLEYQEERLMNSEDLELEMANYINEMAQMLLQKNATLPAGLEEKPYYGSQLSNVDDDPAEEDPAEYEATRKQRRLRATAGTVIKAARHASDGSASIKVQGLVRDKLISLQKNGRL